MRIGPDFNNELILPACLFTKNKFYSGSDLWPQIIMAKIIILAIMSILSPPLGASESVSGLNKRWDPRVQFDEHFFLI